MESTLHGKVESTMASTTRQLQQESNHQHYPPRWTTEHHQFRKAPPRLMDGRMEDPQRRTPREGRRASSSNKATVRHDTTSFIVLIQIQSVPEPRTYLPSHRGRPSTTFVINTPSRRLDPDVHRAYSRQRNTSHQTGNSKKPINHRLSDV